ncbi:MAG: C39 family peptidase [Candidatus Micrarchaeota archaeon]|nr:C39 family peptidase [Candidatus Micrarchaeota archaeon]
MRLVVPLRKQRADSSYECGPACTSMIFNYYKEAMGIKEICKDMKVHKNMGTFGPQIGNYFLRNGFDVEIVSFNPFAFTNNDKRMKKKELIKRFELLRSKSKRKENKLGSRYYTEYLKNGGRVKVQIPNKKEIVSEIRKGRPLIALLTSRFLLGKKPGFNFHFCVVTGFDKKYVYVNDPLPSKVGGKQKYLFEDFIFGIHAASYGAIDNCSIIKIRKG